MRVLFQFHQILWKVLQNGYFYHYIAILLGSPFELGRLLLIANHKKYINNET